MHQFDINAPYSACDTQRSIVLDTRAITQTMAAKPNDASALFELYRTSTDKDTFAAAIIGLLLVKSVGTQRLTGEHT